MTDDRHHRIYENGEVEDLPAFRTFYLVDSEEPELIKTERLKKTWKRSI
jgi:hypothetical protein